MGFLKKFMMENAGAAAVRRLVEKLGNVKSKNILIFVGMGNNGGGFCGRVCIRGSSGKMADIICPHTGFIVFWLVQNNPGCGNLPDLYFPIASRNICPTKRMAL